MATRFGRACEAALMPSPQSGLSNEMQIRIDCAGLMEETEASITAKLKRGTFSAIFLLACLAALEAEGVRLEDI
jgi:hypothetical protein